MGGTGVRRGFLGFYVSRRYDFPLDRLGLAGKKATGTVPLGTTRGRIFLPWGNSFSVGAYGYNHTRLLNISPFF